MTIRSALYFLAKLLGDANAGSRAIKIKSVNPIAKRVMRRAAGRLTGQLLGKLFR